MSSNERDLRFRITSDSSQARTDVRSFSAGLQTEFGNVNRLGVGALRGLNQEFSLLARQIPLVGYPLAGITQQLVTMGAQRRSVDELSSAFRAFRTALAEMAAGGNVGGTAVLRGFGITDLQAALRQPQAAFQQFITGLRGIRDETGQTVQSVEVLGASVTGQLIPALNAGGGAAAGAAGAAGGMTLALGVAASAVLAFTAAEVGMVAGLFKMTGAAADYGQEIWNAHLKTGLATESLSGYYLAAQKAKVPFDQFVLSLARVERSAEEANKGNKQFIQAFADLGIATKTVNTDTGKFIDDFTQKLGSLRAGGAQVDEAFKLVSRSGANVLPVFDQLKNGAAALVAEADRLGLKLTEQQAKQLVAYNISLTQLKASFKGLEVTIGKEFAPVAIQAVQGVTQIVIGARPLLEPIFKFVGFEILNTINQVKFLLAAIETLPYALSTTGDALKAMAIVLSTTAVNFTDLGQVAQMTGAAIYLALSGNTQAASAVMDAALLQVKKGLQDATNIAHIAYGQITDEFKKNLVAMYQAAPEVPDAGTKDIDLHAPPKKEKKESLETQLERNLKLLQDNERKIQDLYESQKADAQKYYDERIISLQEFTEQERALEKARFEGLNQTLAAEKLLIGASGVAQDLKAAKIADVDKKIADNKKQNTKTNDEIDKNQHDKEQAALEQHLAKIVEIQTAGDRLRIEQIKKLANDQVITYAQAEQQIEAIERLALVARRERLEKELVGADRNKELRQKILDDLKVLGVEIAAFEAGAETSTDEAQTKDAERRLANEEAVRKYQEEITRITHEGEAIRLDAMKRAGASEVTIIQETYKQQREAIDDSYNSRKADLEFQIKQLSINDTLKKQNADKIKSIQDEIKALNELHNKQTQANKDEEKRALERGGPNSRRSLFGDTFTDAFSAYNKALIQAGKNTNNLRATMFGLATAAGDAFHQMSADAGDFLSIAIGGFKELTAGIGDLVTNYVMLGSIGPDALRKLLASIIAHYAASWIIKAIDLTAEGFANLAKSSAAAAGGDFAAAALYHTAAVQDFLAAAKYGAGGVVAAVVGREVAGNSGNAAGATSGGGTSTQPNNQTFTYGSASTPSGRPGTGTSGLGLMNAKLLAALDRNTAASEQLHARIDSIPADEFLKAAAKTTTGQRAIGDATVAHSASSPEFRRTILSHMGLNR